MLVLTRHENESIMIGDDVEINVVSIRDDVVRIGITAPNDKTVHRKEVWLAVKNGTTPQDEKVKHYDNCAKAAKQKQVSNSSDRSARNSKTAARSPNEHIAKFGFHGPVPATKK